MFDISFDMRPGLRPVSSTVLVVPQTVSDTTVNVMTENI